MSDTMTTFTAERNILDVLRVAGFFLQDGWFYPSGSPDRAVVRLLVKGGSYQIWRRRRLHSPWMLIVSAPVEEFDQGAFNTWKNSWPLTR